ncbi:MAG TPA: DUF4249 domain-containing protein [Mucilaginibacter sp.]|nr:DUF4249 domain-containing protein [Mucilaginibacter sp.]
MKRIAGILFLSGLALVVYPGCRKAYDPKIAAVTTNYLVVAGAINSGPAETTTITLSRTVKLAVKTSSTPVLYAVVNIEGDDNSSYTLIGDGLTGNYTYHGLTLDPAHKYRLRIKTTDNNKEYLSDYVPVKEAPPIDSIGFTIKSNGIQVYVNSHDPTNSTHYYRWDYEEGWRFHANYFSSYYSDGQEIVPRTPAQVIYTCYSDHKSDDIVLGSSAKLSSDVIYQNPVIFIPSTSEKIESLYGIMLKEYALTPDAFTFWTNMRNNSESLGSIFDPLPSNINGNIHCLTNPSEVVIGYVSAGSVQSKKFFINSGQLPLSWLPTLPYACALDTFLFHNRYGVNEVQQSLVPLPPSEIPVNAIYNGSPFPVGFTATVDQCVDCTLRGTLDPPVFF